MRSMLGLSAVFLLVSTASAGEYNPVLDVGDAAPEWRSLPGVDGKQHSSLGLKDCEVIVVAFTCNSCPYAVDYEDRLVALAKTYRDRNVAVVAINVNRVDEDALPAMKERAAAKGFSFPYLYDKSQQIARDYGATYTPEFFVLDQQRRVAYMGAMDDSPDGSEITQRYVDQAVEALLGGGAPTTQETVAIGCRVRYERVRRSRKRKVTTD